MKNYLIASIVLVFSLLGFGCAKYFAPNPSKNSSSLIKPINSSHYPHHRTLKISKQSAKEAQRLPSLSTNELLHDPLNLINNEFNIPKNLKPRVSFWIDIYTKYGSNQHVIHHSRYPWIVYSVIDTSDIMKTTAHRWTKYHRAKKRVQYEKRKIKRVLQRLTRKKSFKNLKGLERILFRKLKHLKGKRKFIYRFAAKNVRSQLGQRDFYLSGLKISPKYLEFMEDTFEEFQLPKELTRLPFVESSFNINAQSAVGASGIWQIMPRTGASYGIVNKFIDERNSPYKATKMAARLLRFYYRTFKSWPLTITAYNNGYAGVKKAVARSRSRDLGTIIRRYHRGSFKFASSNFYSSFLAALYSHYYRDHLFNELYQSNDINPGPKVKEFTLAKRLRTRTIVRLSGFSTSELLKFNLDLKKAIRINARLPKGFKLIFPTKPSKDLQKYLTQRSTKKFKPASLRRKKAYKNRSRS